MAATVFENYKAQAIVLVPVVRALEKELGRDEAHRIVHDALKDTFFKFGQQMAKDTMKGCEGNFGKQAIIGADLFAEGGALEIESQEVTEKNYKFEVTGCKYSELYKSLDAPELGFLFACNQDYPFQNGWGDKHVMHRPQTRMEGYSRCKFNWYIADSVEEANKAREEEERIAWERAERLAKEGLIATDS